MVEFWKSQQNFEQYRQFLYEMFAERKCCEWKDFEQHCCRQQNRMGMKGAHFVVFENSNQISFFI